MMAKEILFAEMFSGVGGFRLGLEKAGKGGVDCQAELRNGTQGGRKPLPPSERTKQRKSFRCVLPNEKCINTQQRVRGKEGQYKPLSEGSRRRNKQKFRCVWANDNDRSASKIYQYRFGCDEYIEADIKTIKASSIPNHDLLTAGFPCQSFSLAGKRKGFKDTRGTLFHHVVRVAKVKKPPLLLLENVKGLLCNDEGATFQIILESLADLGYLLEWQVLNSKYFGVPQNRERVFIIGHLAGTGGKKIFPVGESGAVPSKSRRARQAQNQVSTAITKNLKRGVHSGGETLIYWKNSEEGWVREEREDSLALKCGHQRLCRQPLLLHNVYRGFGEGDPRIFRDYSPTIRTPKGGGHLPVVVADRTRTYANKGRNLESPKPLSNALSSVQKDNLIMHTTQPRSGKSGKGGTGPLSRDDGITFCLDAPNSQALQNGTQIRRLTPVECERLQGFPDGWTRGVSDTQRYKLLGNAVTVNVIQFLGEQILRACMHKN